MDLFFFFNDTATTEIYTLSLHDALPICEPLQGRAELALPVHDVLAPEPVQQVVVLDRQRNAVADVLRSEEHTSELQSRQYLVCRLLLEKKKTHCLCNRDDETVHPPKPCN